MTREALDSVSDAAAAVLIAGQAGDVIPDVLSLLAADAPRVRTGALVALLALSREVPPSALPLIIAALGDPDPFVRRNSLWVLVDIATPDAALVERVSRMLRDDVWWVRAQAAEALAAWQVEDAIPAMVEAIEEVDPDVGIESESAEQLYRGRLTRALAVMGAPAIDDLEALAGSPDSVVSRLAAREVRVARVLGRSQPIIDMHRHGPRAFDRAEVLQWLDRSKVTVSHLSVSGDTSAYMAMSADGDSRLLLGPLFPCTDGQLKKQPCFPESDGWPDLDWLRRQYSSGRLRLMGELAYVYYGIPPTDERLQPYFALAEELDIPIGIHLRFGVRGDESTCCPNNNGAYSDPALLEPILARYPKLLIYLMHAAETDVLDKAVSFVRAHPNVYVDMSPRMGDVDGQTSYVTALRAFLDGGIIDRVMVGTDGTDAVNIIAATEAVEFLTDEQRRGIYYDNAAKFLRLGDAGH